MTIRQAIEDSSARLAGCGVESARLEVELLLAHLLSLPRLELCLHADRVLTEREEGALAAMVRRRERREPLQHLLGTVCFCGFELIVNRDVLIPRPETEVLAEMAWTHLLERQGCEPPTVLDFGTGSGCVAIAIAHHVPSARVHALDASPSAVGVARQNAALQGLSERIQFNMGDAFAAVPGGLRFDLIVTNPPYIPSGEIDGLEPEVRDHDPRMALDGGRDGLAFYRLLAAEAPAHLNAGGRLMAEFGDGQAEQLRDLFGLPPWRVREVVNDYTGRPRHLHAVCAA